MTDLFILGTSHTLQCGHESCSQSDVAAFHAKLRRLCDNEHIQRIAEAMSTDGLAYHGVTETIGQRVSRELGLALNHQNVDLTMTEKASLSIDDSPVITTVMRLYLHAGSAGFREAMDDLADAIRERIWVARLLTRNHWPTLFICGSDHVQSVRRIFRTLGLDAKVVHRDYEP